MKAPLIVLATTAAGFAAASTYLYRQMNVERVRTQEEVARSNRLEQRVRQLELDQSNEQSRRSPSAPHLEFRAGRPDNAGSRPIVPAPLVDARNIVLLTSARKASAESNEGSISRTTVNDDGSQLTRRMLEDPEARQALRRQQISVQRQMNIDLAGYVGLTKEEEQKLLELLVEHSLQRWEQSLDPAAKNATADVQDLIVRQDTELAALLGPDRLRKLKSYQDALPERIQVRDLRDRLDPAARLTEDQEGHLIALMRAERESVLTDFPPTPLESSAEFEGRPAPLDASGGMQQILNERVRARASSVLNAEQLKMLTDMQSEQESMQRIARKLLRERPLAEASFTR